jgi:hypothetical protein
MVQADADKIRRRFQLGCLVTTGIFYGYFYRIMSGVSSVYWVAMDWYSIKTVMPRWLKLLLFIVLIVFVNISVNKIFNKTGNWYKLFFLLVFEYNLGIIVMLGIFEGFSFKTIDWILNHLQNDSTTVLAISLYYLFVPTLLIWLISFGLNKYFTSKTLS